MGAILRAARAFKERHGHANPPYTRGRDSTRVAGWLSQQRDKFREGNLDPEKALKLHRLGCKGFVANEQGPELEAPQASTDGSS